MSYNGCRDAFKDYVGKDLAAARLAIRRFSPDQLSWQAGHRTAICSLYEVNAYEGSLIGSAFQNGW